MAWDPDAIGDELFAQFAPVEELHGPQPSLEVFMRALGRAVQPIDDLAKDGGNGSDEPGWSQVLDLARAKDEWLRWLGQWAGYWAPEESPDWDIERERIVTRSAHRRGSVAILREAIQEQLSGTKTVIIQERLTGAYTISVSVYNSEITTTAAKIEAHARAQKAAGLIMTFNVLSGEDWNTLVANQATWNLVSGGKFTDWNEVVTNPDKP